MDTSKRVALYAVTVVAKILGCYLPSLWLNKGRSPWLLVPAALSLAVFPWLLTLHPAASGRVYAAYGGLYIAVDIVWLWLVDKQTPTRWGLVGAALCLLMLVIVLAPRGWVRRPVGPLVVLPSRPGRVGLLRGVHGSRATPRPPSA